jgi:hypothetical protein
MRARVTESLIMSLVGIPSFLIAFAYYLILPDNRTKHFGVGTTDEDVLNFVNSEESMGFRKVQFDEGCEARNYALFFVYQCPWLQVSDFVSFYLVLVIYTFYIYNTNLFLLN